MSTFFIGKFNLLVNTRDDITPAYISENTYRCDVSDNKKLDIRTFSVIDKKILIEDSTYVPVTIYVGFEYRNEDDDMSSSVSINVSDFLVFSVTKNMCMNIDGVKRSFGVTTLDKGMVKIMSSEYMCRPSAEIVIKFSLAGTTIIGKKNPKKIIDIVDWDPEDTKFTMCIANSDLIESPMYEKPVAVADSDDVPFAKNLVARYKFTDVVSALDLSVLYNGLITFTAILRYNGINLTKKCISLPTTEYDKCMYTTVGDKLTLLGYTYYQDM